MTITLVSLCLICFAALLVEKRLALRNRRALKHVVHINGIRGKSTVSRMVAAGLSAGGYRVFCKTTGTVPACIGPDGAEYELRRRGTANIKEQLKVLGLAAQSGAEILVIECMAVDPAYQYASQHKMLQADIGLITNVRLDHMDVMGDTLEKIATALSNTIPRNGVLFTAEESFFPFLASRAAKLGSQAFQASPDEDAPHSSGEFAENVELALAVCMHLGVERAKALEGICAYRPDPYALSYHELCGGGLFINGLSINDPQSIKKVCRALAGTELLDGKRLTLLVNTRADRAERTAQMAALAASLRPHSVWLTGPGSALFRIKYRGNPGHVSRFKNAAAVPLESLGVSDAVLAVGNIAGAGKELMARVEKEGRRFVL